jgi:predicted nuclease of restriction endonuclease-like (RecB) superfamily
MECIFPGRYETEALRGGWSVRQLDRQIGTMFYERTALSRDKAAMLTKGAKARPEDRVSADEEVKDPLVLEFLNLKDEYSESELEEMLLLHLEKFLLELGGDFAFVGRQRRLRIADEWYRVDLLFFHRRLRCLVVIDLKIGKFANQDCSRKSRRFYFDGMQLLRQLAVPLFVANRVRGVSLEFPAGWDSRSVNKPASNRQQFAAFLFT